MNNKIQKSDFIKKSNNINKMDLAVIFCCVALIFKLVKKLLEDKQMLSIIVVKKVNYEYRINQKQFFNKSI